MYWNWFETGNNVGVSGGVMVVADMKKAIFFTQRGFEPKIFYQKKCENYDKSNLRQNSVKGPKDPNNAKKMSKSNIKFQNVPKNATIKRKITTLLTFLTKQRKI